RPLSEQNLLIAGPICVDSDYRGQGVVRELYRTLFALVPKLYEIVVVFVSLDNPRSISAHAKLGMNEVSTFCFNEREYVIMACPIS
nr:GNAT family N-acetyltransferase [bacterium]